MRVFVLIFTLLSVLLHGVPVQASTALPPGQKPGKYYRWSYPSQMSYGPIEDGTGSIGTARGIFQQFTPMFGIGYQF